MAKIKGRDKKFNGKEKTGTEMTEKKMKDCGTSASGKTIDVDDPIEAGVDGEKIARIDLVAIDPTELPDLIKFGNQRVRNKIRQLAREKDLPIDLV